MLRDPPRAHPVRLSPARDQRLRIPILKLRFSQTKKPRSPRAAGVSCFAVGIRRDPHSIAREIVAPRRPLSVETDDSTAGSMALGSLHVKSIGGAIPSALRFPIR